MKKNKIDWGNRLEVEKWAKEYWDNGPTVKKLMDAINASYDLGYREGQNDTEEQYNQRDEGILC
jgi:hypothetical protein